MRLRENARVCMFCDISTALLALAVPSLIIYFASLRYGV